MRQTETNTDHNLRMLDFLITLDFLELLTTLSPRRLYPQENMYWRFTGLILLLFLILIVCFSDTLGYTAMVSLSIITCLWLFIHSILRSVFKQEVEHNSKSRMEGKDCGKIE